jgi:hypothetical protein
MPSIKAHHIALLVLLSVAAACLIVGLALASKNTNNQCRVTFGSTTPVSPNVTVSSPFALSAGLTSQSSSSTTQTASASITTTVAYPYYLSSPQIVSAPSSSGGLSVAETTPSGSCPQQPSTNCVQVWRVSGCLASGSYDLRFTGACITQSGCQFGASTSSTPSDVIFSLDSDQTGMFFPPVVSGFALAGDVLGLIVCVVGFFMAARVANPFDPRGTAAWLFFLIMAVWLLGGAVASMGLAFYIDGRSDLWNSQIAFDLMSAVFLAIAGTLVISWSLHTEPIAAAEAHKHRTASAPNQHA